ncbi:MAG: malate synthase G, partial [Gammaproteobacteria bacterium]|nr:malate synthase G [Gammaproteobacteria bacterium]
MTNHTRESYVEVGGLRVAKPLHDLVQYDIAPGTGVSPDEFWSSLAEIIRDCEPKNRELLAVRDALQEQIDAWYLERQDQPLDVLEHKAFLNRIGYLVPEGEDFSIAVDNVDPELAQVAGPQLVVPVDNARYALNAANARWGSLYDALYGTDVIDESDGAERGGAYNPARGRKVIAYAKQFLDQATPLEGGNHADVTAIELQDVQGSKQLKCKLTSGVTTALADPSQFTGYQQSNGVLTSVLLRNHGLHIEIRIDPDDPVGREDPAGICDLVLEAAVTSIQDF